jgi:hypothetical protein
MAARLFTKTEHLLMNNMLLMTLVILVTFTVEVDPDWRRSARVVRCYGPAETTLPVPVPVRRTNPRRSSPLVPLGFCTIFDSAFGKCASPECFIVRNPACLDKLSSSYFFLEWAITLLKAWSTFENHSRKANLNTTLQKQPY